MNGCLHSDDYDFVERCHAEHWHVTVRDPATPLANFKRPFAHPSTVVSK